MHYVSSSCRILMIATAMAGCLSMLGPQAHAVDNAPVFAMAKPAFHPPCPAIPYYHFTATLDLPTPGPVRIHEVHCGTEPILDYLLIEKNNPIDRNRPHERRRMVIARGLKSIRPEQSFEKPILIGRLDWRNGQSYAISVALSIGGEDAPVLEASSDAVAPASGGYPQSEWMHYQSIILSETTGLDRKNEPVQATFLYYPDTLGEPSREIRILEVSRRDGSLKEIPSQVIDSSLVPFKEPPAYDKTGELKPATYIPTGSATVVFMADVPANQSAVYLIQYGNPDAPETNYQSDLAVAGDAPGLVIENAFYRMKLHEASGMLDEVTIKAKPELTFVHKKETNGAIQWNPDCYAPPRPWVHLSDWETGTHNYQYAETRGPVTVRTRRWGDMPFMPELACSMEFEFYAGVPWFRMRSAMHVKGTIDAQALRNAEVVFAREAFSEAAWWDVFHNRVETRHIIAAPDLTEWTMPADTPWLAFFDRTKGCGYAGIQTAAAQGGISAGFRTLNPYMYITVGPWIYWTRALAYPYGGSNPQQIIRIQPDSVFLEEWAYLPFSFDAKDDKIFDEVQEQQKKLAHPLEVKVEAPIDPRMEVPEEIYIEPGASGWEE